MTDFRDDNIKIGVIHGPVVHAGAASKFDLPASNAAFQPFHFETIDHDGSYAVSFPIEIWELAHRCDLRGVVDIEVNSGAIGIGSVSADYASFVSGESVISAGPRRKICVPVGPPKGARHLMLRNATHGKSAARVHGVELRYVDPAEERLMEIQSSLWDAPAVAPSYFSRTGGDAGVARRTLARNNSASDSLSFSIAVTHTSRAWDLERCRQDYLRDRYRRPGRLDSLPPFESLPSAAESRAYRGRLTLFDLIVDSDGIQFATKRCIDSEYKLNHACKMGNRLVISLDDQLAVVSDMNDGELGDIERIDDPWFAGLQTIFAVDDKHCVISASAPDALMLMDFSTHRVVRRWRVPSDRYGRNYELSEATSVHDHFIANDMQLAHLNCAFPDGHGGFWISTLAQGDIGHVASDGSYELIASGFVGCHGIRYSHELDILYFSDSCTGRVIGLGPNREPRVICSVESRWLHDAQHLVGALFLLSVGDQNAIAVVDSSSNEELARFDMEARGTNVQFINLFERRRSRGPMTS